MNIIWANEKIIHLQIKSLHISEHEHNVNIMITIVKKVNQSAYELKFSLIDILVLLKKLFQ